MKQIKIVITTICMLYSISSSLTCADKSDSFAKEIEYCLNNPWPMHIVSGQIIDVIPKYEYDKSYLNSTEHVDFSVKIKVLNLVHGKIAKDTIEIIPGPAYFLKFNESDFKIGTTWIFLIQEQVAEIWNDLNYPSNLFLGKICGYPIAKIVDGSAEGISINSLKSKFKNYDSKINSLYAIDISVMDYLGTYSLDIDSIKNPFPSIDILKNVKLSINNDSSLVVGSGKIVLYKLLSDFNRDSVATFLHHSLNDDSLIVDLKVCPNNYLKFGDRYYKVSNNRTEQKKYK